MVSVGGSKLLSEADDCPIAGGEPTGGEFDPE